VVEVVIIVAAAFVLALLIQQFVVKPYVIPSESMEFTLQRGDRVLANRFIYRFRDPQRGDVVVFVPPMESNEPFIKRVVAIGGDRVAVKDGRLYLNGEPQVEPYVRDENILGDFRETTVREGAYFVMGDNRNNSGDSRVFGVIDKNAILGQAFFVYWPLSRVGGI
jgi:signal peptidase I